ncbi:hypothetical protein ACLPJF_13475 [Pseudomonas vlassakiae]|uniref:hypothetical protein n=1 Tax=Pseudomonas vlassakiae TaxID=485888 RepID=UPI003D28D198
MSCEVAVAVPELKMERELPDSDSLSPEEWKIVQFYRRLGEPDREWMRRMLSALAAHTVPE